MRKEIIAIGIIAMIAVSATLAMAVPQKTAADPIEIEMNPDTLNLNSGGEYVTAFINEDYLINADPSEYYGLYLTDDDETMKVEAVAVCYDDEPLLAIKFPRAAVLGWLDLEDTDEETAIESSVNLYVKSSDADLTTVFTDEFNIVESKKKH